MRFTACFLFIKICCNCFCFFVVWNSFVVRLCFCVRIYNYNFITNNCWIIYEIFSIFTATCSRIPNMIFFMYMIFLQSYQHLSLFHHWSELHFLPSNLHLHLHDRCFVNVFDLFIPVIMLNTLRFKFYVLFGIHPLLYKLLKDCNFQHIYLI